MPTLIIAVLKAYCIAWRSKFSINAMHRVNGEANMKAKKQHVHFGLTKGAFCLFLCLTFLSACSLKYTNQSNNAAKLEHLRVAYLESLASKIDARVAVLKILAKNTANDTHIHAWLASGMDAEGEARLIQKLEFMVNEYQLTSASFADKNSNKYWNHEGFLRVLDPKIDTWYFAYVKAAEQDLISVYHDKNKHRVDLYVNYQQLVQENDSTTPATGLSGIATSFDGVIEMMEQSESAKEATVFIVDKEGLIQIHPDPLVAGRQYIQEKYPNLDIQALSANDVDVSLLDSTQALSRYMPNMGWYLFVEYKTK